MRKRSQKEPRRTAETMPMNTPLVNQMIAAPTTRKIVLGSREKMSDLTDVLLRKLWPKSKCRKSRSV
jgi:hypothetical protein